MIIYWSLQIYNYNVLIIYLNSIEKHLPKCRSNIMDVAENLSAAKKNEIQHLMHMVQLVSTICMHPHQFVLQVD